MLDLKKADYKYAKIIANYLSDRIKKDELLKTKLENTDKTLVDCLKFIKDEAKKQAQDGVAVIEDKEVFGWAVHFFVEDDIKLSDSVKKTKPIIKKLSAKEKLYNELTLFDFEDKK